MRRAARRQDRDGGLLGFVMKPPLLACCCCWSIIVIIGDVVALAQAAVGAAAFGEPWPCHATADRQLRCRSDAAAADDEDEGRNCEDDSDFAVDLVAAGATVTKAANVAMIAVDDARLRLRSWCLLLYLLPFLKEG